jgi:hypothetical protein
MKKLLQIILNGYGLIWVFIIYLGHFSLIKLLDLWLDTNYFCYEYYDDIYYLHHPVCDWFDIFPYAFFLTIGNIMLIWKPLFIDR